MSVLNDNLAIILTARLGSERSPNKALADINGKPLIYWIIKRLQLAGNVILATTDLSQDDKLCELATNMYVPFYRGDKDDVVSRMDNALNKFMPNAEFVMRGLGDCPFISPYIVSRATRVLSKQRKDAFAWFLPPHIVQRLVYGSREFPYSRKGWQEIVDYAKNEEREHIDIYFHKNRDRFKIAYHEAPPAVYFRNYRLEVDWIEDIELVRRIGKEFNMLAELENINRFLDINDDIPQINRERVEKTGLSTSYTYAEMREWFKGMKNSPVICWDDTIWKPIESRSSPIFCDAEICLLGYAVKGVLYRKNGDRIKGKARIHCSCGADKSWNAPI